MKYREMNNMQSIYFICLWLMLQSMVFGQETEFIVDKSYDQLAWQEFTNKVQRVYPVRFFYNNDSIPNFTVNVKTDGQLLKQVLENNLSPLEINFVIDKSGNIFLTKELIYTTLPDNLFLTLAEEETLEKDSLITKPEQSTEFLQTKK